MDARKQLEEELRGRLEQRHFAMTDSRPLTHANLAPATGWAWPGLNELTAAGMLARLNELCGLGERFEVRDELFSPDAVASRSSEAVAPIVIRRSYLETSNIIEIATVVAHEFGHSLGARRFVDERAAGNCSELAGILGETVRRVLERKLRAWPEAWALLGVIAGLRLPPLEAYLKAAPLPVTIKVVAVEIGAVEPQRSDVWLLQLRPLGSLEAPLSRPATLFYDDKARHRAARVLATWPWRDGLAVAVDRVQDPPASSRGHKAACEVKAPSFKNKNSPRELWAWTGTGLFLRVPVPNSEGEQLMAVHQRRLRDLEMAGLAAWVRERKAARGTAKD